MIADVVSRDVFVPSPGKGIGVMGGSYYTRPDGQDLLSLHTHISRSDTADVGFVRRSADHGKTWSEPVEWPCAFDDPRGQGRRHPRGGYVDPATGRYLTVWTQGVLPSDNPLEGLRQWTLWYSISEDGGATERVNEQVIHEGEAYDATHHLPGVTVGHNCVMMGDRGQTPLTRSDGAILVPVQSSPVGPDGNYHNPGAGYTYTDCLLLIGRWRDDGGLNWTTSQRIEGDPSRTTRGMIEPTIAELDDGRIIMVMRGSNDRPQLPGHKWVSYSSDGGDTWTTPEPWCFDDGEPMLSPSSCSQLVAHSSGCLLWLGNRCTSNPLGNGPRYPLIMGEVDRSTGAIVRDSVTIVDDRRDGESERLTLSNFYAREERGTGDILVHCPRFFATANDFTADLIQTRVRLR